MSRLRSVGGSAKFEQYCRDTKRIINSTAKMLRMVKTKLTPWNTLTTRRNILSEAGESKTIKSPRLPEFADVVIIGGGNAGCNALYHLAKRGSNAILLERSKLTSGTTWHTAGMFWRLRPNDVDIQLLDSTRNMLTSLEEETGLNPGWIQNGGIFIAHNETRMDEYKRLVTAGKFYGVEAHVLTPKETKDLFPLLDENAFVGSIYSPQDGSMDPAMLTAAITKAAKSHGAKIIEECPVNRIITEEQEYGWRKVIGVETPFGVIRTKCVLNAAGAWSKTVAKMAGVDIPLIPMKHAYVVTEPMDGVQGLPNIRDHDGSIYIKIQGSSMSIGGYEPNPIILCNPEYQ